MHEYLLKAKDAIEHKNLLEAKMWYGCIVALDENQLPQQEKNIAHYMLAHLYSQTRNFADALVHYKAIQHCIPDNALLPLIIPDEQTRQLQQHHVQKHPPQEQPLLETDDDYAWQRLLFAELQKANIPAMSENPSTITITKIYSLRNRYTIPFKIICQNARELFFNENELLFGVEQAIEAHERNIGKPANANQSTQNAAPVPASREIKKFAIPESISLKNKLLAIYIKKNNCLAVMLLLDAETDIRLNLPNNFNALQLAAGLGHAYCLRILLIENAQQKRFEPLSRAVPIVCASQQRHINCLLELLCCANDYPAKSKARIVLINCQYWSALQKEKPAECKNLLEQTGTNLVVAALNDDDILLKTYLDCEYFIDQIDQAFFLAVRLEKMKCLAVLAQANVDPDLFKYLLIDTAIKGNTKVAACLARTCLNADRIEAMKIAANHGQSLVIKTLLRPTDDLDFKIAIILATAAKVDQEKMAPLLELRDNFDYTVLHSAARALRYRDVMALLSAGANPDTKGHENSSIIEDMLTRQNELYRQRGDAASAECRYIEIATLLLDSGAIIKPSANSLLLSFISIEQQLNQSSEAQQSFPYTKKMQFYFKCLFDPDHLGNSNRLNYLNLLVPVIAQNHVNTLRLLVEYTVYYLNINPNKKTHSFRLVDNLHARSFTPQRRFESPQKNSDSPQKKPDSPVKSADSSQSKSGSPLKCADSAASSSPSTQRNSGLFQQRVDSPIRIPASSQARLDSPLKRPASPQTRTDSPQRNQSSGISNNPAQNDNTYYELIKMSLQKEHFECAKLLLEQGISTAIKIKVENVPLMDSIRELLLVKEFQQLVNLLPRLTAEQEQHNKQHAELSF